MEIYKIFDRGCRFKHRYIVLLENHNILCISNKCEYYYTDTEYQGKEIYLDELPVYIQHFILKLLIGG